MKLLRWLLALVLFLLGLGALLAGGFFFYKVVTDRTRLQGAALLLTVCVLFLGFGAYLCIFAIRTVKIKGPLLDPAEPNQESKSNRFMLYLFGALAVILTVSHPGGIWRGLASATQTISIFAATCYLVIALHECGHLFAGLAVGAVPQTMLIGTGGDWFSFYLGKLQVRVGRFPFRGLMVCTPGIRPWTRRRFFIFVLGGPLASVAGLAAIFWYCERLGIPLSLRQDTFWKTTCVYFFFQSLMTVIGFFWMAPVTVDGRLRKPDLALLLDCLFRPGTILGPQNGTNDFEGLILQGKNREAWEMIKPGLTAKPEFADLMTRFALVLDAPEAGYLDALAGETLQQSGIASCEKVSLLLTRGTAAAKLSKVEEAGSWFEKAFAAAAADDEQILICEHIANLVIQARLLTCLADADNASLRALKLCPNVVTLSGTRGSILVEMDRFAEGISILEKVYSETESDFDKAICAFYLALAHGSTGMRDDAVVWRKRMDLHSPPQWLLQRLPELADRE